MTIAEMHLTIRDILDNENTPRFESRSIDRAINSACDIIVSDRYDNEKKARKNYSFQSSAKLRDQLGPLVDVSSDLNTTAGILAKTDIPAVLYFLIGINATLNGVKTNIIPITYEEEEMIYQDPKRRPSSMYPVKAYYVEGALGYRFLVADGTSIRNARLTYIRKPAKVSFGTEVSQPGEELTYNLVYTAYIDTTVSIKNLNTNDVSTTVVLAGNSIVRTSFSYEYKLVVGILVYGGTNCDLPTNLHEEVCRKTATLLMASVENYNREKDIINVDVQ